MPGSVYDIQYGVNFSELLSNALMKNKITKTDLAKVVGVEPTAISNRLKKPAYGSIYDLIEASIFCKTDLISPAIEILENAGISVMQKYSTKKYRELEEEISIVKEDNIRYKKTLDKLL